MAGENDRNFFLVVLLIIFQWIYNFFNPTVVVNTHINVNSHNSSKQKILQARRRTVNCCEKFGPQPFIKLFCGLFMLTLMN